MISISEPTPEPLLSNGDHHQPVARPLKVLDALLEEEIQGARDAARNAAQPFFQRAGLLLMEGKVQLTYEQWPIWVQKHAGISMTTSKDWMRYAKELPEYKQDADGGLFSKPPTLNEIARPSRDFSKESTWIPPVRNILSDQFDPKHMERLKERRLSHEKECKLIRELAAQIINLGYKILATKMHPDKNGSEDAMRRLN